MELLTLVFLVPAAIVLFVCSKYGLIIGLLVLTCVCVLVVSNTRVYAHSKKETGMRFITSVRFILLLVTTGLIIAFGLGVGLLIMRDPLAGIAIMVVSGLVILGILILLQHLPSLKSS